MTAARSPLPDTQPPRQSWGVVATIKAPVAQILGFAAHHLDLGAAQVCIYLDDDNPAAVEALHAHPHLRVTQTDAAYWRATTGQRPDTHQTRQSANMMQAYTAAQGVDWLAHIDVDELLRPATPLADQLTALPAACLTARVYPIEALAPDPTAPASDITWFKACSRTPRERRRDVAWLYPAYKQDLVSGFLSHKQGKLFVRTGYEAMRVRIHNASLGPDDNPGEQVLDDTDLCHLHAPDWPTFLAHFAYRHALGSYRPGLQAPRRPDAEGRNLHQLFADILAAEGEPGLRRLYDTVCTATPAHIDALQRRGLLRACKLDIDAKIARHFPDWQP